MPTAQDINEIYDGGFRAGTDAALRIIDQIGCDWRDDGQTQKFYAANYLAEQIRSLKPQ